MNVAHNFKCYTYATFNAPGEGLYPPEAQVKLRIELKNTPGVNYALISASRQL